MTPKQKRVARHALGLRDGQKRSYRNRFVTSAGGDHYDVLMRMVRDGNATRELFGAGDDKWLFALTPIGAKAALEADETLDPEDFPTA